MADYGRSISLSRDFSPTSDDDVSSDQSPRSLAPFSSPSPSLKLEQQTLATDPMQQLTTQRKPRGRPRGSKNKPKPPVFITKETHDSMKPVVLEISPGSDVIESIVNFANRMKSGISVVSASGSVSNVSLSHPCMSLNGPFNLLSLHGYVLSSGTMKSGSHSGPCSGSGFGICLAGAQGHVFGGIVGGKVIAATTVIVVAATFLNPAFHKLPGDEGNEAEAKQANAGQEVSTSSSVNTGMSVSVYGSVANPNPITTQLPPHQIMNWVPPSRSSYN